MTRLLGVILDRVVVPLSLESVERKFKERMCTDNSQPKMMMSVWCRL